MLSEARGNFSEQLHNGLKDKGYLEYEKQPTVSRQTNGDVKQQGIFWSP